MLLLYCIIKWGQKFINIFLSRDVKPSYKLDTKNFMLPSSLMRGFQNGLIYLFIISGSKDISI